MAVLVNGSEIILSGTVGDLWFEDGFTSGDVYSALAMIGDDQDIVVRLNSGGGIANEGSAIHAALTRHKGKKTIVVEGIAASAASLIAMAGDEIEMARGSLMMIHDPATITIGTVADHDLASQRLNAFATTFAGVYAAKSGRTVAQCRADMKAEIWLTPEDAVAQGYADRVGPVPANDNAEEQAVAAFDYRVYAHAPKQLVAMAKKNDWRMNASRPEATSVAPTPVKEKPMPEKTTGATTPEDIEAARKTASEAATAAAMTAAAEIATICTENGVPAMASALIKEGVTAEQAKARATSAKDIKMAIDTAKKAYPAITADADEFLTQGKTLNQVQAALFEKITAVQSPEIASFHQPSGQSAATASNASMQRELKRAGFSKEA